jgi:hypothetical protein
VTHQLKSLDVIIQDFKVIHQRYHELLEDEAELQTSHAYYQSVMQEINHLFAEATQWCHTASRLQEVDIAIGDIKLSSTLVKQHDKLVLSPVIVVTLALALLVPGLKLLQRRQSCWQRKLP